MTISAWTIGGARGGCVAIALLLGPSAFAQGTAEQREACAPDAIKLCSDTIPDETTTKACMQRHVNELTPRCRRVFLAATEPPSAPESPVPPPDESAPAAPAPEYLPPPGAASDPMANYKAAIAEDCREGLIDPFTCRNTMRALRNY